jgi:hypothetical protein
MERIMNRTDTMAGANEERKVALRRETLRELTAADLRLVAGGTIHETDW